MLTVLFVGAITGVIGALIGSHLMEALGLADTPWQMLVGAFIGAAGGVVSVFVLWKQDHFNKENSHRSGGERGMNTRLKNEK